MEKFCQESYDRFVKWHGENATVTWIETHKKIGCDEAWHILAEQHGTTWHGIYGKVSQRNGNGYNIAYDKIVKK